MEKTSFIKELVNRRVPQIIGLYIAATWMMIEIGDWMTERFSMPQEVTSYIFIGMAFFIPSVFYLAFQYGKPGRDPWKKPTFVVVPGNLMIAFLAMFYLVEPVEATETKVVVDEKGVEQAYEVPKQEFHKKLVSFFWRNNSGDRKLDWMQYGLPWLLSEDLDRSLFISSSTPFDSRSMLKKMKKVGFDNALNIPNSMQLEVARKRFAKFSINGDFNYRNDKYELNIDIYDVKKGKKIATHSVQGEALLTLLDELSDAVKKTLNIPQNLNEQTSDLPVAEHISQSLSAIEKYIQSKIARHLNNDYASAKMHADEAIKEDFSFAYAYTELSRILRLIGQTQDAAKVMSKALKHEYKFTMQNKFYFRAQAYGIKGDHASQVKVYDMWVELFPDDIQAHELRAEILLLTGLDHDKALQSLFRLRQLNPGDDSVLQQMTRLFILKGELQKAIDSQLQFVSLNPSDISGLIELAEVFERNVQFDEARNMLERVLLLEDGNLEASMKLVSLDMKTDQFEIAESRLSELMETVETSREKFQVLTGYHGYYALRGEIEKAIEILDKLEENAEHLPPILRIFTIQFPKAQYLATLERKEEALSLLKKIKSGLQAPLDSIIDIGFISVYTAVKDTEKLKEVLANVEESLKKHPNPMFDNALDVSKGQIMETEGKYEEAVALYQKSYDAVSGSVVNTLSEDNVLSVGVLLARAKNKAGRSDEAEKALLEIIKKYPTMPTANFELADLYFDLGEYEKFEQSMSKVARVWSNADQDYTEYKRFLELTEKSKSKVGQ